MLKLKDMFASDFETSISIKNPANFNVSRSVSFDLSWTFATVVFITANIFGLYRIFFGVNFFDEPFYAALPFRFLHGQKLFMQDFTLAQTFAITIYPFVKVHSLLFHSTEYLILFLRCCHWALNLGLELILFYIIKKELTPAVALIIVSSFGLFLPGNIPTLSYNTLGTLFLTLGLFTSFFACYSNRTSLYFFSGISMGLCALTYVTFISITILVALQVAFWRRKKSDFFFYAIGILFVLAVPAMLLVSRLDAFQTSFALSKEYGYSVNKFITLVSILHKLFPKQILGTIIPFFLISYFSCRRNSNLRFLVILFIPIFAFILSQLSTLYWSVYPFYLSILALIPLCTTPKSPFVTSLINRIFIPSILAGFVAALTSALGSLNAQVGLVPAVLASLTLIYLALAQAPSSLSRLCPVFLAVPVFLALGAHIDIWDESPINELTEKITQGPFHGLYTSQEKKKYLDEVSSELLSALSSKGPLLIYPNFTAGYLIAGVSPASGLLWYQNPKGGVDSYLAKAYKKEMTSESRILRMKVWYATPALKLENIFNPNSPINKIIDTDHFPITDNQWFTLYAPSDQSSVHRD
jgi:hypothetical protein